MLMTLRKAVLALLAQERLNFLLTNRIPRRTATIFFGWFSRIEQPLVARLSIGIWRRFADLRLEEAKETTFPSMHACFVRELKPGRRPFDPDPAIVCSPCDAILGAHGQIEGTRVFQAKGFPYSLGELLGEDMLASRYADGSYATLRITSSMYHRFHAPCDGRIGTLTYMSGDTWNVNPIALARVERLFCRNERAVVPIETAPGQPPLLLVPVAAILVGSIRFRFADVLLHLRYKGPYRIPCEVSVEKGQELGWFQHGSTIVVVAPRGYALAEGLKAGSGVKAGERLMRMPAEAG